MAKSGKAPKGYYSASQTMRKLNIASSTLYHFVEVGKIRRIVPPDMKEGYYSQEDVEKMAREREIFFEQFHKEPASTLPQENGIAILEEQDIVKIVERLDRIQEELDRHTILLTQILEYQRRQETE